MALTVTDVRARIKTGLDNTTLQRMLTAAEKSVARSAGSATVAVETYDAMGNQWISLRRRSTAITSIVERRSYGSDPVTLEANDWRKVGGYKLLRLTGGTNSASTWGREVIVTYVPEIDAEIRDRVALDLVELDVEFRAFDSESVGDWAGVQRDYKATRRDLLSQVREGRSPVS